MFFVFCLVLVGFERSGDSYLGFQGCFRMDSSARVLYLRQAQVEVIRVFKSVFVVLGIV